MFIENLLTGNKLWLLALLLQAVMYLKTKKVEREENIIIKTLLKYYYHNLFVLQAIHFVDRGLQMV